MTRERYTPAELLGVMSTVSLPYSVRVLGSLLETQYGRGLPDSRDVLALLDVLERGGHVVAVTIADQGGQWSALVSADDVRRGRTRPVFAATAVARAIQAHHVWATAQNAAAVDLVQDVNRSWATLCPLAEGRAPASLTPAEAAPTGRWVTLRMSPAEAAWWWSRVTGDTE